MTKSLAVSVETCEASVSPRVELRPQETGEVFTRPWVVDFMLDLSGYTADRDLALIRVVEPSCGQGAFLSRIVSRLSESLVFHQRPLTDALNAICAIDIIEQNVEETRATAEKVLLSDGWGAETVISVVDSWLTASDYLLLEKSRSDIDLVIGNPPYIRLEDLDPEKSDAYRTLWPTMGGRADIYVGFMEAGLRSLSPGGCLTFICADRWMRNQYGSRLRTLVGEQFSVETLISAHDVDAFETEVSAYPAIFVIRRQSQGQAFVVEASSAFNERSAVQVVTAQKKGTKRLVSPAFHSAKLPTWFKGPDSWPSGSPERLDLLKRLNEALPLLEESSPLTKVGIGVATGADSLFVVDHEIDIEEERLLPLVMSQDTREGELHWSGHFLVNPWDADGSLVSLEKYPRLAKYFEDHELALRKRHVATTKSAQWYRTIDKVNSTLVSRPKLLFPDMRMKSDPVLETGGLYPHHNLYYVVSEEWDLAVLGGLLMSKVAEMFIDSYAVKMRGGTLRFQAQYLRRVRVPYPQDIRAALKKRLSRAFLTHDFGEANSVAAEIYGLNEVDKHACGI